MYFMTVYFSSVSLLLLSLFIISHSYQCWFNKCQEESSETGKKRRYINSCLPLKKTHFGFLNLNLDSKIHFGFENSYWIRKFTFDSKIHFGFENSFWIRKFTLDSKIHFGFENSLKFTLIRKLTLDSKIQLF